MVSAMVASYKGIEVETEVWMEEKGEINLMTKQKITYWKSTLWKVKLPGCF